MELLFTYGMLQREDVQLATFGRLLQGVADSLPGYRLTQYRVEDPKFVAESGKEYHAMARYSGNPDDHLHGIVYELTDDELAAADRYEPTGYRRVSIELLSGRSAWFYTEI